MSTHALLKPLKTLSKSLSCLSIINPYASLIVETDSSDIKYGGILKQSINGQEQLVLLSHKKQYITVPHLTTIKLKLLLSQS